MMRKELGPAVGRKKITSVPWLALDIRRAARTVVRRALGRLGLERIHHPSFADLMRHECIRNVLDVGANEGQFASGIRQSGYRGRIVSFEPVSVAFDVLERRAQRDPLWDVHRLGLSNMAGDAAISVTCASVFSSFKPLSAYAATKFAGAKEQYRETVPVVRLDDFLSAHPELLDDAYLKIDTQGFEREVLMGLGDQLSSMKAVQLELPLRLLYEGQATMVEILEWMHQRGFQVAMVKENGFDWTAMRLLEVDMVFVRD